MFLRCLDWKSLRQWARVRRNALPPLVVVKLSLEAGRESISVAYAYEFRDG